MKTKFLFFAILFQIFITLFGLIYSNSVLKFGESVALSVELVDPRDLLRGNYVRLSYDLPEPLCKETGNFSVYAIINGDRISELSCTKPKNGIFIKGDARAWYSDILEPGRTRTAPPNIRKKYYFRAYFGIEAFFTTPQNAKVIEKNIRDRGENFVNLRILNGKAVIESLQSNNKIYGK